MVIATQEAQYFLSLGLKSPRKAINDQVLRPV
jgi:hypothetical protein